MAITKDAGRQSPLVARVAFSYLDLGAAVTASRIVPAIDLPAGAIVLGGYVKVLTAWAGTTAATVDVGDGGDPDRYSASAINLMATAGTTVALSVANGVAGAGYEYTAPDTIDLDVVLTVADASAGSAELVVEYIIDGRANEVQG